jgi:hypothetical protein
MKRAIWKYVLRLAERTVLRMPEGAQVLSVQVQGGGISLWALVDADARQVDRTFVLRKTGCDCDGVARWTYLATVFYDSYVWHVFEDEG